MVKSLTELFSLQLLYVNATSSAVSGSPSVNSTSSRIFTVQVRPSPLTLYSVARSVSIWRSCVVTVNVLWISGSCTCSPAPHPYAGSNPEEGSDVGGMVTMTSSFTAVSSAAAPWASVSSPASGVSAGCVCCVSCVPTSPRPHPANTPETHITAHKKAAAFLFIISLLHKFDKSIAIRFFHHKPRWGIPAIPSQNETITVSVFIQIYRDLIIIARMRRQSGYPFS